MEPEGQLSGGELYGSDENERRKVSQLRALVEEQDPAAKEMDNLALRRFLRARNLDIKKACSLLLEHLKWRRSAVPNGFISEAEIQNELLQKKSFAQGFDKMGRPIGVVLSGRHKASKRDLDEFKRFVVYVIDRLISRMERGQDKFCFIGDLEGWGYSNFDFRGYMAALDILQNNYPERLGKVFMVHVPYIFMKAWRTVYPFVDKNTKHKFVFVEDKSLKATLLEDIDESQLPEKYGGSLPLVPIEESN